MESAYPIENDTLERHLTREYGIQVEGIHFIPKGDSAYCYRVDGVNGDRYFFKLLDHQNDRQLRGVELLKYYLPLTWSMYHEGCLQEITYPIKTLRGNFQTTLNNLTAVLFNFIDGETLTDAYPFSNETLREIARSVAKLHRITPVIDRTMLLTETFDICFVPDLVQCLQLLEGTPTFANRTKQALRGHILPKKAQIAALLELIQKLRYGAITDTGEKVLCHGDIWGGNLIRQGNSLHIVDWESAIIAPRELDLMGFIGDEFGFFFSSYEEHMGQSVTVKPDLLRFYSYRHHLRNLTNWLMNILYRNTDDAQSENDLEMILHHCMNRWDSIEIKIRIVEDVRKRR